jgi:hypothetical protein
MVKPGCGCTTQIKEKSEKKQKQFQYLPFKVSTANEKNQFRLSSHFWLSLER